MTISSKQAVTSSACKLSEMANVALPLQAAAGARCDDLLKIAHQRLKPSLMDPSFLVLRARRAIFQNWISQLEKPGLDVLDVGGRYQPYRPLFKVHPRRYIACDILQTELVSVVGNGESLPFAPGTFDVVIASQVFDYFSQPQKAAEQIREVLRPGGSLLMSAPSFAPPFAEGEAWRFTSKGIRTILWGFSKVTIVPEISSMGGLIRTANLAACSAAGSGVLRQVVAATLSPMLNLAGLTFESLALTKNEQFTPNYSVLAIK